MKAEHHGRTAVDLLRCLAALVLLAGLGLSAHAGVTLSQFPPNPGVMPGGGWQFGAGTTFANPPPARAWVNGVYGSVPKFVATDSMVLAGRAGALPVAAISTVGLAEAAGAIGRCVIGANVWCAAGTAAYLAYKAYRLMPPSDVPGSVVSDPTKFDSDPGQGTILLDKWVCTNSCNGTSDSGLFAPSPGELQTLMAAGRTQQVAGSPCRTTPDIQFTQWVAWGAPAINGSSASVEFRSFCGSTGGSIVGATLNKQGTTPGCGASIDASNPAYNIPAGSAVGPDGKCPTARYNHSPKTVDEAVAKILANPPSFPSVQWGTGLKDSIDKGGQTVPSDVTSSGPASQTGTPATTTTTQPDGTVTTTTETPTFNYSYPGDKITYTQTNSTTVQTCVGGGSCSTTTTTGTGGGGITPQDPKDPCTANPTRAGCMDLGSPPTDVVPKLDRTLSYSEESVALPVGCPAANVIAGRSYSYAMICDTATNARPWVLIGAAFSALMLVIVALRSM